jgi:hypothetical protein
MMELRAVGLLSPGDMGHVVGHVLIGHGMPVVTCLAGRSERTRVLAQKAGIQAVPTYEDLVRDTDVVLSILVPAEAENAARRVVTALRQASETTVYVDCNAIAPATAERIGGLIAGVGSRFVSASIIGPPPRRTGTTRFYASGTDVEAFEALAEYGLDIRPLGAELGHAKGDQNGVWRPDQGRSGHRHRTLSRCTENGALHGPRGRTERQPSPAVSPDRTDPAGHADQSPPLDRGDGGDCSDLHRAGIDA